MGFGGQMRSDISLLSLSDEGPPEPRFGLRRWTPHQEGAAQPNPEYTGNCLSLVSDHLRGKLEDTQR